ncbi:MAG: hypothetical protein V4538_00390 [Bacteroidota bacterium]
MIYVNKENIPEDQFTSLLEVTKNKIIKKYEQKFPKVVNGNTFETDVYNEMILSSLQTDFEGYIEQTSVHAFPDIIAKKLFGVEVKMTSADKWISTGNSVLESTRIGSVETIYMFFGKFGNDFNIKYRKYQDCLYDVGVTHSPRYKIDMDLQEGLSIFNKLGIPYDNFRKETNPIKRIKEYYKKQLKQGEELWWISETSEDPAVSPIIQSFNKLEKTMKEQFINECFVLFPEMFGKSTTKFDRAAPYLIKNYNAVSASLRDNFTAGGKQTISVNGNPVVVSRLIYNLFLRANDIKRIICDTPYTKLSNYWGEEITDEPLEIWKKLLEQNSKEDVDIISVFNEGIKKVKKL